MLIMKPLVARISMAIALVIAISAHASHAGEVLEVAPAQPDPAAKYLFYMHGKYIEREGPDGDHKYAAVLEALAAKGLVVIGEVRSETDAAAYSQGITRQVRSLLDAGVPAANITVSGYSRGGFMTMLSAIQLQNDNIKFGVMAGCGKKGSAFWPPYAKFANSAARRMRGHFLVAWDAADRNAAECDLAMSNAGVDYRNLVFKTGAGHYLFFKPQSVWIDPLATFALSD